MEEECNPKVRRDNANLIPHRSSSSHPSAQYETDLQPLACSLSDAWQRRSRSIALQEHGKQSPNLIFFFSSHCSLLCMNRCFYARLATAMIETFLLANLWLAERDLRKGATSCLEPSVSQMCLQRRCGVESGTIAFTNFSWLDMWHKARRDSRTPAFRCYKVGFVGLIEGESKRI